MTLDYSFNQLFLLFLTIMNIRLQHAKIKDRHCVCVNTRPSRGNVIPRCIAVERLLETHPCPAKTPSPCAGTMNTVQDDREACWQNLVKCIVISYPCLLTGTLG